VEKPKGMLIRDVTVRTNESIHQLRSLFLGFAGATVHTLPQNTSPSLFEGCKSPLLVVRFSSKSRSQ